MKEFSEEIEEVVYTPKDIQKILKIKEKKCYAFLSEVKNKTKLFNVKKIGKLYRIPKLSFDSWFYNKDLE